METLEDQLAMPLVDVRGLVKRYGDFTAVEDLTIQVSPGEVFVLLGPNGAGKTTTIRMLMGILQPSAGSASIAGRDCFSDRAAPGQSSNAWNWPTRWQSTPSTTPAA